MRDGTLLRGELLMPPASFGAPRVVVALSHAMMVDRRTLDQPAGAGLLSALLAAGASVLWFDLRGHGQSTPLPQAGASWDYDELVADAGVVAAALAARFPGLPRIAVGHSLFGHVALAHQARASSGRSAPGFDGIVLLGANVWLRSLEPRAGRWWLKRASFFAMVAASRPLGYLPVRRLRLGTADEPLAYLRQMGDWLGRGSWDDRQGNSYSAALSRVRIPLLSVAGAGDRLLAVPACQLRLASLTAGQVTHITVGKRFGYGCDPDHMGLVLDRRLEPLWREIAAWAGARTSAIVPAAAP
jgi:predicted alpha/beta hydrolase